LQIVNSLALLIVVPISADMPLRKGEPAMSISSISSSSAWDLSTQNTSATTTQSSTKQAATEEAVTAASHEDTVKLSAAAQAKLMEHSGLTVKQIATNLATDTKTVDQYLGITSTSSSETAALLAMLP
jgi:hypothetical protein